MSPAAAEGRYFKKCCCYCGTVFIWLLDKYGEAGMFGNMSVRCGATLLISVRNCSIGPIAVTKQMQRTSRCIYIGEA